MTKCILCKDDQVTFYDNYKLNVISDKEYFGKTKIYKCEKCEIGFCDPMPKQEKLNFFYNQIYRSTGRPHQINFDALEKDLYSFRNLNYIQYLTTFIDFKNIKSILDFGSGLGDIGFLLKKKFSHLKLFSCENDKYCRKVLNERTYKVFDYNNFDKVEEKFDLIISTHSLEHMVNFDLINEFKKKANPKSYLFIEVPNCPLNDDYKTRPYDSPHLIFFSKKSMNELYKKFNLNLLNLNYSSYTLSTSFKYMKQSKKNYENWSTFNKLEKKIKDLIRKIIPKIFFEFKHFLYEKNLDKLDYFVLNKKDSWCVRGLFKLNKDL